MLCEEDKSFIRRKVKQSSDPKSLRKEFAQHFEVSEPTIWAVTAWDTIRKNKNIEVNEEYSLDNPIKQKWRLTLAEFAKKNMVSNPKVLLMPGDECLDVPMFIEMGIDPKNIWGVDRDCNKRFLWSAKQFGINIIHADMTDVLSNPGKYGDWNVYSLDYFGCVHPAMLESIHKIKYDEELIFMCNVRAGRENHKTKMILDEFSVDPGNKSYLEYIYERDQIDGEDIADNRENLGFLYCQELLNRDLDCRIHHLVLGNLFKIMEIELSPQNLINFLPLLAMASRGENKENMLIVNDFDSYYYRSPTKCRPRYLTDLISIKTIKRPEHRNFDKIRKILDEFECDCIKYKQINNMQVSYQIYNKARKMEDGINIRLPHRNWFMSEKLINDAINEAIQMTIKCKARTQLGEANYNGILKERKEIL